MPRLFTALEIPAEVASSLTLHRGGLVGARWIEPADYHITLRFLGDVDRRMAHDVDSFLNDVGGEPLTITLDQLGSFGGDRPRAVFARVQPSPKLNELQADLERLMRRLGLPAESRKFTPHVTLARLRNSSPEDVARYLSARGNFAAMPFRVDRFVLMSSRESVGGGPYVVEEAWPLARAKIRGPHRATGAPGLSRGLR